jgi:hypothetical protein
VAPAEHAARALAALRPRHRELLIEAEADEHPVPDDEAAEKLSWALAGD